MTAPLAGKVALVAGATRGAGRGIAVELGRAGATVYCTGRSTLERSSDLNRPETIEETAERVTAAGGVGIPVRVDHTVPAEVEALFERVRSEQDGRLDILVNDIWGGEKLTEWGKPFWELEMAGGLKLIERAIFTHLLTSRYGVPLMVARGHGLVIEITDGDTLQYRGNLIYDFIKTGVMWLALGMAEDLRGNIMTMTEEGKKTQPSRTGITAVALTPGFLRSEEMLEHFGVTEANWQDGADKEPYFLGSETPHFVGRAVAALAADPNVHEKSGQALSSWGLSDEYGFSDLGGATPHWGRFYEAGEAKRLAQEQ